MERKSQKSRKDNERRKIFLKLKGGVNSFHVENGGKNHQAAIDIDHLTFKSSLSASGIDFKLPKAGYFLRHATSSQTQIHENEVVEQEIKEKLNQAFYQ